MEKLAGNTVISLKGFKDKGPDNLFKIHYKVKNLKRKCLHWVRVYNWSLRCFCKCYNFRFNLVIFPCARFSTQLNELPVSVSFIHYFYNIIATETAINNVQPT